jgi:hypothetical protein
MKRYILCVTLIFLFIGIMHVTALANTPPISYNNNTVGLFPNPGIRAAQYTTANMGLDFRPNNPNWTNISSSNGTTINVPHNATFVNFLYWDFGTYNGRSSPNFGWHFEGTFTYRVNWISVNINPLQTGVFTQYVSPPFGNPPRARLRYVAIDTNHLQRTSGQTVTIELFRWNNVIRNGVLVPVEVRDDITFNINWTGNPPPPPPNANNIIYNSLNQTLSGISASMEYNLYTTFWNGWTSGTGQAVNLSSFLCTRRATYLVVRYRSPQSAHEEFRIPPLTPAPTHLSITWENGSIFLQGFRAGSAYAFSRNSNFTELNTGFLENVAGTRANISDFINPGDTLFVREIPSGAMIYSDVVRLVAPTARVPNVIYDRSQHHLIFPAAIRHWIRMNSESDNDWVSWNIPSPNTRVNIYPFLSSEHETRFDIEDDWSYPHHQAIIIPPLEPAPDLWFEWISDLGLVLWGLEEGHVYDLSTVSTFNTLSWFEAEQPGRTIAGLQPGNVIFVRAARDFNSPPSDFIRLTVPPYPHDIETSLVGLKFENGVFSYDAINIYDRFKVNATRQRFVVIRRHDANGNVTTSPVYPVNVVNAGGNLLQSSVAVAFRNFTADEQIEILVYRENARLNRLSRQVIHPMMFAFE